MMKEKLRNYAATLALLFALFGYTGYTAQAQTCDGSQNSRDILVYGTVTNGTYGVTNMPVRAYAWSPTLGLLIKTTHTNQGQWELSLDCGRPYYITVDTKHPNGHFGRTPDASPQQYTFIPDANTPPYVNAGVFTLPYCDNPFQTQIASLFFGRPYNGGIGYPAAGGTVVARNPQDNSLQDSTTSFAPAVVEGPGGGMGYNYSMTYLFPCTNYTVEAVPNSIFGYISGPTTYLVNTGFDYNNQIKVIDGVEVRTARGGSVLPFTGVYNP